MSILAEFVVPADTFVLADTLTTPPDMRIEIKRVVGGKEHVTPYLWAYGSDFETFEASLRSDETVQDVLTLDEQPEAPGRSNAQEERFYRVTWEGSVPNLIDAVSVAKATVLEAVSSDGDRWEVKVLFPDDEALATFNEYGLENDFSFEPRRLYRPENPEEQGEYELTSAQLEALKAAYQEGYYNVPRDITLTELAETLDISQNALSTRLRRGNRNLLSNTIVHDQ